MEKKMTLEQAIEVLHPDNSLLYLRLKYGEKLTSKKREARLIACAVMQKEIEKQQKAREERL
jgi:hypothetical protein